MFLGFFRRATQERQLIIHCSFLFVISNNAIPPKMTRTWICPFLCYSKDSCCSWFVYACSLKLKETEQVKAWVGMHTKTFETLKPMHWTSKTKEKNSLQWYESADTNQNISQPKSTSARSGIHKNMPHRSSRRHISIVYNEAKAFTAVH